MEENACCFIVDGRIENCFLEKIDKNSGRSRCAYKLRNEPCSECDYFVPKNSEKN